MENSKIENISFREKDKHQQFLNTNGEWEDCDEVKINNLWQHWVVTSNKPQYRDSEGFIRFEYENRN